MLARNRPLQTIDHPASQSCLTTAYLALDEQDVLVALQKVLQW